jgi:hypothetical protein
LGQVSQDAPEIAQAQSALDGLLSDDASAEVGVAGHFELRGRLYHWRLVRQQPRIAAVRSLFQLGYLPKDDRLFNAMLAASLHVETVCGQSSSPPRFSISQWRTAGLAAGGLDFAEVRIRAARRDCFHRAWQKDRGDPTAFACEVELAEIVRQISGRLV